MTDTTSAKAGAELIAEVTAELAGSLNLHRAVLRLFGLLTPRLADWAMLAMANGETDRLDLYGGLDPRFRTSVGNSAAETLGIGRVLRSGRGEVLHAMSAPGFADGLDSLIPHAGLRAEAGQQHPADVLGVGLSARGSTIGVLVLVRGDGRGFPQADVELVERVAARAAIALDSARLYQERAHLVSVLQASLRPPALAEIPGLRLSARFRPAAEDLDIGGDFYDVHGAGDDWLLVLGDVCGKGVEAAVLTGRARQSIRTAAHFVRQPSGVLAALNSVLYEAESDRFVTAVCARLRPGADGESAELDLAVAGHPAPLVVRADGRTEQVEIAGTVAGVLPNISYREVTVRLERGDTMLMFTDGIYEARGEDGFYGLDRLAGLLPRYAGAGSEPLCEAVEQDVIEYLDGRAHDDMTLLAISCGR